MGIEREGFLKIGDQLVTLPGHYPAEFGERYNVYTRKDESFSEPSLLLTEKM